MNVAEKIPVIVDTASGKLEGVKRLGVSAFKGIVYATARRWQAPQREKAWAGGRAATRAGNMAPQNPTALQGLIGTSGGEIGEDCLSLNVWTPSCDGAKRPVMVWIHGGAFVTGAGSLGLYNGTPLATTGDVVVVTINYRLGAFGFLRLAEIGGGRIASTGSEGLQDAIMALEWVRDHVGAFGGDAANVTIFGESAGGMAVAALLASPHAHGLYHKAICQSGGGHIGHTPAHASRIADVLLRHLGVGVAELESVPVAALLKAQLDLLGEIDSQQDPHQLGTLAFQPAIDGSVLTQRPIDAVRGGSAKAVPLIAGTTTEEWKLWTALDSNIQAMDEAKLERWAERMFGNHAASLLAADRDGSPYERYVSMQTDRAFREPALRLLAAQSAEAPVYEYVFDWRSPALDGAFGACHALELGFVFGSHSANGPDKFFGTGAEADALNLAMMQAWTSFAHTGVPRADGAEAWPKWSKAAPAAMLFGADSRSAHVSRFELPAAWAVLPDQLVGS